ncbi:hypothetical protein L3Y34_013732 [Caenorhabditis briggsae]|uniref:Uncharacterized protein n=1 Tax=Caenorhabditis briggsae TaxID=6238 RepID=A0AAE8ZXM5_CAEBR|nr:hypothetical protein L3Y34_013732 [Caenorhabditis briggsae]
MTRTKPLQKPIIPESSQTTQYEKDLQKKMEKYDKGVQEAIVKHLPPPTPRDFGIPVDLNKSGQVTRVNFSVDSLTPIFSFLS